MAAIAMAMVVVMTHVPRALLAPRPTTVLGRALYSSTHRSLGFRRATSSSALSRVAMSSTPAMDPARWAARLADAPLASSGETVELTVVPKIAWKTWLAEQPSSTRGWLETLGRSKCKPGEWTPIPGAEPGSLLQIVCAVENASSIWALAALPAALPTGKTYQLNLVGGSNGPKEADAAALSWALGCYEYDFLKNTNKDKAPKAGKSAPPLLVWPAGCDRAGVSNAASATYLCRDLITTPCEQLGPADLERAACDLAARHPGATVRAVVGDALLAENFPMVHAVGRAAGAGREPRLVELRWGREGAPKVAVVGKGVAFDTGGLDIKPSAAMLTMKKDMGGAAHALGLASMAMTAGLDIDLRVLLPIVENSISGNAFRPGDVLTARNGRTTEIGNTDAEGRLILADALVYASEQEPELIIDMATLTGASRVALGADVPSVFSNDDALSRQIQELSAAVEDQVWPLPLWEGYRKQIKGNIADLKNVGSGAYGGAITAALYLSEFVGPKALKQAKGAAAGGSGGDDEDEEPEGDAAGGTAGASGRKGPSWLHMDVMAYNQGSSPGKPEGGEAQGMRAFFALLQARYGPGGGAQA